MENYKIGILGMGGVGGYVGAKLAAAQLPGVSVIFIARNQTKEALKQNGIKLLSEVSENTAFAQLVSDDPVEIGLLDLLICAVKAYNLEESLIYYAPCLKKESIVLPLLNGIGIPDQIRMKMPTVQALGGCIYIISRIVKPGVIKQTGATPQLYFGSKRIPRQDLEKIEQIFKQCGIKADIPTDIEVEVWKKFFLVSVAATFTSYYNAAICLAQKDTEKANDIIELLVELEKVALIDGIDLPEGIVQTTYLHIMNLDANATSSMYADFQNGGPTEVEQLTGDVVRLGKMYNVSTPLYTKMYKKLISLTH